MKRIIFRRGRSLLEQVVRDQSNLVGQACERRRQIWGDVHRHHSRFKFAIKDSECSENQCFNLPIKTEAGGLGFLPLKADDVPFIE